MIPKNIITTYSSWNELAPELQQNLKSMSELNLNWKFLFFSDADVERFIVDHYDINLLKLYHSIDPVYGAARADFFRYLVLYKIGGVYMDVKSLCCCSLDSLVRRDDVFILGQWSDRHLSKYPAAGKHIAISHVTGGEFVNWFICSAAGHPFLERVIQQVSRNLRFYSPIWNGVGKGAVLHTTGPIAFTLAIYPILNLHSHRLVRNLEDYGIHYSIKDGAKHEALFVRHYSHARAPLIKIGRLHTIIWRIGKSCKAWLRRILTKEAV